MRPAALARLLRGELRGRRLRSMALFAVVVALASAALVGGLEGQTKASDRWDAAFAEANGAHVTIDGDAAVIDEVARLPEVASSTPTYPRSAGDLELLLEGQPITTAFVREVAGDDLPDIARPLLRDGDWAAAGADDEIVIDRAFGIEEGVAIGDQLAVSTPAGPLAFTVVGRAVDLVDCFYPSCDPVTVWLDPAGFERLATDTVDTSFLRLHEPEAVDEFISGIGGYPVGTQGWIDTRDDTLAVYEIFGAFLGAFGVFVMIAAAVVVAGSMATRAVARRRDIGLLKAMGTTPRQVAASIVLAHAAVAAAGVLAGWVLGGLLAPVLEVDLGETLGTGGASFSARSFVVALIVVELIVLVAIAVPAWRTGRQPTTAALASVTAHPARGEWLGRVTSRLGLGPVGLAGLRDSLGRPARSILTTIALALAVVAALVTIGTNRSIDRVFGDPTLAGDPEELRLYPVTDTAGSEIPDVLERTAGVESWFTETPTDLALGNETFLGIAMGDDVAGSGFAVQEGRMFARSGEAVAGWGLLSRFDLAVGDSVTVDAAGSPVELTIVGWYREGEDTGEILRFPLDDLQAVQPGRDPEWASVNLAADVDPVEVAASVSDELAGAARVEVIDVGASDEIDAFRIAFLLVSALVIVVAFANLLSTMLLAARERSHDFGVLRAVGVTPRQVVSMVAVGAATLAIAAGVVGIPLAWLVTNAVTEVVGAASGLGPGIGVGPGLVGTIIVVPAVIGVAAALGALASRHGARSAVADLVRYE